MAPVNEKQKNHLIDFVCEYYTQLFGKLEGPFGKEYQTKKWDALTVELNKLGTEQTTQYWRKV